MSIQIVPPMTVAIRTPNAVALTLPITDRHERGTGLAPAATMA